MPPTFIRVQIASLMVIVLSATTVLIIGGTVRRHYWLKWYLGILFTIGVVHEALLVVHGPDHLVMGRGLIPMWCICLAAGQAAINTKLAGWARVGMLAIGVFCFYGLLMQHDWISGWPARRALGSGGFPPAGAGRRCRDGHRGGGSPRRALGSDLPDLHGR